MSKNALSKNTPAHSSLNDIERDTRLDPGFEVEYVDATEPEAELDAKKWHMTPGVHKLRATSLDKVEEVTFFTDQYGEEHEIAPHWSIGMEDIKTGEFDYIEFPIGPKQERSFALAVNTRSHWDLARKIAPGRVEKLTVKSVAQYLAKFPVEFRYDQNPYVDEVTGEHKLSKPKICLWNPEDFVSRKRSQNWVSLR